MATLDAKCKVCEKIHFVWFSMRDGFPSPKVLRRVWDSEKSGEKSISHVKPYKVHFLGYFTLQGTFMIHASHDKYTAQSGIS